MGERVRLGMLPTISRLSKMEMYKKMWAEIDAAELAQPHR